MFEVLKGHTGSCQRRTCLKWQINGELSANDRSNLMKLLCQVDKQACIEELSDADLYDESSQRLTQRRRRDIIQKKQKKAGIGTQREQSDHGRVLHVFRFSSRTAVHSPGSSAGETQRRVMHDPPFLCASQTQKCYYLRRFSSATRAAALS